MDIDRILKMETTERDRLGMILSNRMDIVAMEKACISIDKWEDLASDLLKWHESLVKSALAPFSNCVYVVTDNDDYGRPLFEDVFKTDTEAKSYIDEQNHLDINSNSTSIIEKEFE